MSEWTSLSCKTDTKERVKGLQAEDEGQDDVLNRALDALEENEPVHEVEWETVGVERLEEIEELLKDMDVVSNNQRVLTRIEDLETELKAHFERELGR